MKFTANLTLILLVIPLILIGIIAATIRFKLLDPAFWQNAFDKNNVYSSLSVELKKTVEEQTVKEGGSASDVKILTNLITPENLKDFMTKNLMNFLNYANGKISELNFYLPIGKFPKGLLPKNIAALPEQVPVTTLMQELNANFVTPSQIQSLSLLGKGTTYFLVLDIALAIIFLILLFVLTGHGAHFVAAGISLIVSGLITLFAVWLGAGAGINTGGPGGAVLETVLPSLLTEILALWQWIGIILVIAGIVVIFFKKR